MIKYRIAYLAMLACLVIGCNKPSVVGGTLVDDDVIVLNNALITDYTLQTVEQPEIAVLGDDVEICQAILGENNRSRLVLSNYQDQTFGTLESEIYVQWVYNLYNIAAPDSLDEMVIDSVYIRLPYTSSLVYGDTTESFSIDVFPIEEFIDLGANVNLDQSFMTGSSSLLVNPVTITPRPTTTVVEERINSLQELDTVTFRPHIKLNLDPMWAQTFLSMFPDSVSLANDTTLLETFPGMVINTTGLTNAILGFDGTTAQNDGANQFSMQMHYTITSSGTQGTLSFIPGIRANTGILHNRIDHDFSGSEAEIALNNPTYTDTTLLIGRHAGLSSALTIREVDIPEDAIINLAELSFTTKELNRSETTPPADDLLFYYGTTSDDGERNYAVEAFTTGCSFNSESFGGQRQTVMAEDGTLVNRYTVSITDELQDLVDNTKDSIQLIFTTFTDIDNPRVITLEGPKSDNNPLNLRVLYSTF